MSSLWLVNGAIVAKDGVLCANESHPCLAEEYAVEFFKTNSKPLNTNPHAPPFRTEERTTGPQIVLKIGNCHWQKDSASFERRFYDSNDGWTSWQAIDVMLMVRHVADFTFEVRATFPIYNPNEPRPSVTTGPVNAGPLGNYGPDLFYNDIYIITATVS